MPRCLLIDGHGLMYRAFFAMPAMSTRDGRPTQAVFGFIRMLNQLLRGWTPSHVAVTFDAGLPAQRMRLLKTYKAQRPSMPAALREQIEYVKEYLATAAIPVVMLPGEEADDVIASLTERLRESECEVLIGSSDKDLFQLVTENVCLVTPAGKPQRTGVADVLKKTGVVPARIVGWLALTGDNADNIPGVPGIGAKTATRLLNEFGDLPTLWQRLDAVRPDAIRQALQTHRAIVERNEALMRLRRDLPVSSDPLRTLSYALPSASMLRPFFEKYELTSLAAPISAEGQGILAL